VPRGEVKVRHLFPPRNLGALCASAVKNSCKWGKENMKILKWLTGICLIAVLGASVSIAAEKTDIETADTVAGSASGKFGRGCVNLTTGWCEMIYCPMEITRERGRFLGATWGPLKGIAMTGLRTIGGALEAALFFYPLPGNYDPYFTREFVFSKPCTTVPPK
jgi:putative exosortase-associated protein (TIGR04073 family)